MSLKISKVSKKYGDQWILRDVSLEVLRGEIFGLLGANESGKTTALEIIAGLEKADAGKIFFDDRDLTDSAKREFCFIRASDEETSVWKNIFFKNILKMKDFSEGVKQKVSFEKSLFEARNVLLLDEPFVSFDRQRREEAFEKLRRTVKEKDLTVILSLNDDAETFAVCERVGVLHNGEIIQIGTPRELYEKPDSVSVAAALGRCNFIEAMRVSFNNQIAPEFQTLKGEHRLQPDKTAKKLPGAINAPVTLAVRPEHISISFGASFPEDNLLKAKISNIHYRGATTLIELDANGLLLEALVLRLVGLNIGDECMVGLPPDRIQVLKD
ncbi:MAG: ABC transporter ATP-binding protein [Pyrinomonadaceae bacterium]